MDELVIGNTRIPVKIRPNGRLKSSRMSVDQSGLLVEVPLGYTSDKAMAFIEERKAWVFSQWEDVRYKRIQAMWPENLISGSKVMFLGRMNLVTVRPAAANRMLYTARGFEVEATEGADLRSLFIEFFQDYLGNLLDEVIVTHALFSGFVNLQVKFTKRKDRWAYCDEQGVIHIGWDLVALPKKLIEYVLVHELCHLLHRNHSDLFWSTLQTVLPDYDLKRNQLVAFESQIEI